MPLRVNETEICIDVLVGHPEHDLLFVTIQVARAAGLKNPSAAIFNFSHSNVGAKLQVQDIESLQDSCRDGHRIKSNSWLFDEPRLYQMLLRSNNPTTEPFRKWVTEEVLPTIRKTARKLKASPTDACTGQPTGIRYCAAPKPPVTYRGISL